MAVWGAGQLPRNPRRFSGAWRRWAEVVSDHAPAVRLWLDGRRCVAATTSAALLKPPGQLGRRRTAPVLALHLVKQSFKFIKCHTLVYILSKAAVHTANVKKVCVTIDLIAAGQNYVVSHGGVAWCGGEGVTPVVG